MTGIAGIGLMGCAISLWLGSNIGLDPAIHQQKVVTITDLSHTPLPPTFISNLEKGCFWCCKTCVDK